MNENDEIKESPEETLEYIKRFMSVSRQVFVENGFYYIFWGAAIPFMTGLSYLLGYLGKPQWIGWAWLILYAVAFPFLFIRERRKDRKVSTFEGRILGSVWAGVIFAFISLLIMLVASGRLELSLTLSLVAAVLGVAYWIDGSLMENPKVKFLAVAWWLVCPLLAVIPEMWTPAVMGVATILLDLIPGLIFYSRSRREN